MLHLAILKVIALVFHDYPLLSILQRTRCQSADNVRIMWFLSSFSRFADKNVTKDVIRIISTPHAAHTITHHIRIEFYGLNREIIIIRTIDFSIYGTHRRWLVLILTVRCDCEHRDLLSFLLKTTFYALYFSYGLGLPSKECLESLSLAILN